MNENKYSRFLIGLTIFLSSYILFRSPFEGYITYLVMVIFFPVFISRYGIPKLPLLIFAPLLVSGWINIQIGENEPGLFFKIFIGLFSSVLFYRYVIEAFNFDINDLFRLYIRGALIVSVIGIFQIFSFFIGFGPGYDFVWFLNKWGVSPGGLGIRMNSIFSEPAYFAGVVGPAFFVAIYNLLMKKEAYMTKAQSIVIVAAYLLTFSSLGIISIFVAALLLLLNYGFVRYAILVGPLLFFGYTYAYNNIDEFRDRVDGTVTAFSGEGQIDINEVHGSSFVLYNNYVIAVENFKRNPFFGTGLGSHPLAFEKYSLTNAPGMIDLNFNKADANSMLLRLLSETGLYGVIIMLSFVIYNIVPRNKSANDTNWLVSNGILVVILVYLMRQGHYFINGFPFFLWLYYYVRKYNDWMIENPEEAAIKEAEEKAKLEALQNNEDPHLLPSP